MGRFICKFDDGPTAYYLEWSTVVDAPVTFGMSLDEFKAYYRDEYGRQGMDFGFEERMKRVEEKGTSSQLDSCVDDVISGNRAGKDETCLSKEQIIEWYCRRKDEHGIPHGLQFNPDTEEYEEYKEEDEEVSSGDG
jgi:hypothetical protein